MSRCHRQRDQDMEPKILGGGTASVDNTAAKQRLMLLRVVRTAAACLG